MFSQQVVTARRRSRALEKPRPRAELQVCAKLVEGLPWVLPTLVSSNGGVFARFHQVRSGREQFSRQRETPLVRRGRVATQECSCSLPALPFPLEVGDLSPIRSLERQTFPPSATSVRCPLQRIGMGGRKSGRGSRLP